jgi:hypothetical protein
MNALGGSYTVEPDVEVLAATREGGVVGPTDATSREMAFEIDQQARIFTDALNLAAVRDTRIAPAARSTSVFPF